MAALTPLAGQIQTPATVIDHPSSDRVVKLEFGLLSSQPRRWTGKARLSSGSIQAAWGWNFNRPDRIVGDDGWDLHVRAFIPPAARYRFRGRLPNGVEVLPNGVFLGVEAPESDTLTVETNHGDFSFALADLDRAKRLEFLGGEAAAVAGPAVRALTRGEASQHDFPAAVQTGDGLFVAWTTFHNEANAVNMAWRREGRWETHRVTPEWGDYYGTAVAADARGRVHVLWSECSAGRWRLVDRAFDPGQNRWNRSVYIAPAGTRQFFAEAVTAADGGLWAAWQEFGASDLDVMAARFDGSSWSPPVRVSVSDANDWAPSLAAAPDGSVWVAWDSYHSGSYDVLLRRLRSDGADPPVPLPPSPNRSIEPSVAIDSAGRVWVAWAESGPNWGKDWGVLGKPGTQVRASSEVRLARYANGRWTAPATSLSASVPGWMADMHEYPTLVMGANDVPYVFFRKMMLRQPVPEHELLVKFGAPERRLQPWYDTVRGLSETRLTAFDGSDWLPPADLPLSAGGAYAQLAVAVGSGAGVAVWPTDGRSYEEPHVRSSQLRYADLDLGAEPAPDERMVELLSGPADYVDAAPTEARDLERVRAARWPDKEPLRLYRGDLHRHTDLSADSQRDGDILLAYRYALDAGALDFLAVTDHSGAERIHYYKYQWWRTRQIATMFQRPGRFATFFGYERTVTFPGGHRNIISTRRDMLPVPISDEEFTGAESWAERLYPDLLRHGDIAIAHTTAGGGGTDWRDNDPRAEPVVEVFQALRGSYEEPNSPGKARTTEPAGFVWSAWRKGWRIGLLSNSDHESTHQSYACVWASELSSRAILDAIKARRTYAATDNIVLAFEALPEDAVEPVKMGREIAARDPPPLQLRAAGTASITSLEIVRSGEVVYSASPGSSDVSIDYRDADAPRDGAEHYHARLVQADGQIAWSSPIWVEYGSSQ